MSEEDEAPQEEIVVMPRHIFVGVIQQHVDAHGAAFTIAKYIETIELAAARHAGNLGCAKCSGIAAELDGLGEIEVERRDAIFDELAQHMIEEEQDGDDRA